MQTTAKILLIACMLAFSTIGWSQVIADFSANVISGCSPLTTQFQDKSTGSNLRYLWTFGNGNVSTKQNPQAIYYQPGKYPVSLEVTDSTGKKDIKTYTNYITVFKNPVANFSATPLSGCAPLSVTFSDKTTLGDTSIGAYLWDFGDGNTTISSSPNHTYQIDGKFNISLLVVDKNGCQDKIDIKNYIEVDRKPEIDFSADRLSNCEAPFTVNFSHLSKKTSAGDKYLWDFGDGNTSTSKNPSHTYTAKGEYSVTLTITTPNGCSSQLQKSGYIYIGSIKVDFIADKVNICNPTEVFFTNRTKPSGLDCYWDFGDGNKNLGSNIKHTYTAPGTYSVTLRVVQSADCIEEITKENYISVVENPTADFTYNDTNSCQLPFLFKATSTSQNAIQIEWKVGSSVRSNYAQHVESYTNYGDYKLKLLAKKSIRLRR